MLRSRFFFTGFERLKCEKTAIVPQLYLAWHHAKLQQKAQIA